MTELQKSKGKFPAGQSGNPGGRPKGSKNKITLLKLMGEEAARNRNMERAQEVIDLIYEQAMEGDKASQKLVWSAHMSPSSTDDKTQAKEKVEINITGQAAKVEQVSVIEHQPDEEDINE
jgi:hypothetical protein